MGILVGLDDRRRRFIRRPPHDPAPGGSLGPVLKLVQTIVQYSGCPANSRCVSDPAAVPARWPPPRCTRAPHPQFSGNPPRRRRAASRHSNQRRSAPRPEAGSHRSNAASPSVFSACAHSPSSRTVISRPESRCEVTVSVARKTSLLQSHCRGRSGRWQADPEILRCGAGGTGRATVGVSGLEEVLVLPGRRLPGIV
jgi:hypothetical protein